MCLTRSKHTWQLAQCTAAVTCTRIRFYRLVCLFACLLVGWFVGFYMCHLGIPPPGDFVAAVVGRLVLARDVLPRAPPGAAARTAGQSRTVLTAPKGVVLLNSFATIWMVGALRHS